MYALLYIVLADPDLSGHRHPFFNIPSQCALWSASCLYPNGVHLRVDCGRLSQSKCRTWPGHLHLLCLTSSTMLLMLVRSSTLFLSLAAPDVFPRFFQGTFLRNPFEKAIYLHDWLPCFCSDPTELDMCSARSSR